jgi:hypothetical protein
VGTIRNTQIHYVGRKLSSGYVKTGAAFGTSQGLEGLNISCRNGAAVHGKTGAYCEWRDTWVFPGTIGTMLSQSGPFPGTVQLCREVSPGCDNRIIDNVLIKLHYASYYSFC